MTFTATRRHQFISWQWGTWTLDPDRSCLRVRASSYLVFQVQRQVIVFSPGDIHRSIRSSIIRPEVEVDLKHLFCSSWNRQNVKCSCRCCVAGATNMQRDTEMCKGIRRHRGSVRLSLYKNIVHIFQTVLTHRVISLLFKVLYKVVFNAQLLCLNNIISTLNVIMLTWRSLCNILCFSR